ncbi:MAG TPA: DUF6064 family protein [Thermoanaerobaculia bacterium]|nr:DUF6064 family protein [Thermoanaerobaculia bacterium]
MSEWWTYHLSNFLLFSPHAYARLIELYNAAIWPGQLVALAVGMGIGLSLGRPSAWRTRNALVLLAVCWLWVGVGFQLRRYATINWAAVEFAWAFGIEAILLGLAAIADRWRIEPAGGAAGRIGLGLFLFALVVQPLVAPLLGRGWGRAEVFGVLPDPTAIATLGFLLLVRGRGRGVAMIVPVLWCLTTGLTLLAMNWPDFAIPLLAAALAVGAAFAQNRRGARRVSTVSP